MAPRHAATAAAFAIALLAAPSSCVRAAGRAPGRALPPRRAAARMSGGSLVDWLRASGATAEGVSQRADGLLEFACEVRPGDKLLSVPEGLHLSEAGLRANVVGSFLDGWPMAAGEPAALAVALLHEVFLADASPWAGYVRALPPAGAGSLDVPVLWNEAEQAELAASTTLPVAALLAEMAADYAWLSAGPFAQAPDLFPPAVYSRERYAWAHAVALSRAVRLDGKLVLVPGVGEASRTGRARQANVGVELRSTGGGGGFGFFGGGKKKSSAAVLVASAGAPAGAAASLGADLSPAECLWSYGQLPAGRAGECELRVGVGAADRLRVDKEEVLRGAGLAPSQLWTLRSGGLDRSDLLKYLRLVALQGARAAASPAARPGPAWRPPPAPASLSRSSARRQAWTRSSSRPSSRRTCGARTWPSPSRGPTRRRPAGSASSSARKPSAPSQATRAQTWRPRRRRTARTRR